LGATAARVRGASVAERILGAARKLATEKPLDRIGLSEVARTAGVSWPTVKRHVGNKAQLRERLLGEQPQIQITLRDTRTRLLDAAERIFARDGYERATLDDVAEQAGLTKGAVYWHFDAKGSLFFALLERHAENELAALARDAEAAPVTGDAQHALARFFGAQLARLEATPESARLLVELVAHAREAPLRERLTSFFRDTQATAVALARKLQDDGKLSSDLDPATLGALWTALMHGVLLAVASDTHASEPRALANKAARLFARGSEAASSGRSRARTRR
jgi:AcrR family transcriptional regulator